MYKLPSSVFCLLLIAGLVAAADVTLVKFDKDTKELTVNEGDAQKTYKVNDKTRFIAVDKASGESKVLPYDVALKGLCNKKAEGKLRFSITVKDGTLVEAKLPGRKKQ